MTSRKGTADGPDPDAVPQLGATPGIAIAAPHRAAVDAAEEIVRAGGNAVDAAVAAAAALTVVYPHQCSVGGDVHALLRHPDGTVTSVDASGRYGTGGMPPTSGVPLTGPHSVTVPGAVSGWMELLAAGGSMPPDQLLAPAIRMAADGVEVTARLALAIIEVVGANDAGAGLRQLVTTADGQPLRAGDRLHQQALAETLSRLATDGLGSFYDGALAASVAAGMRELGVPVTEADLACHRAVRRRPVVGALTSSRVTTAPPSSQGYLLPLIMLGAEELERRGTQVDPRTMLELFRVAATRRDRELADPDHMQVDVEHLLDPSRIEEDVTAVLSRLRSTSSHVERLPGSARPGGDTVAVTVVGQDGTAVSLIQSLFHSFGSKVRDPRTGVTFHNRAAGFSSDPSSPNVLRASKRPAHSLMPVLVEHDDGTVAAHGAMGGRAQAQIHAQVLQRRLDGVHPQAAVDAPRFVVGALEAGDTDDLVLVEPRLGSSTIDGLSRSDLEVRCGEEFDEYVGHAMLCALSPDGELRAGADPRSDGDTRLVPAR